MANTDQTFSLFRFSIFYGRGRWVMGYGIQSPPLQRGGRRGEEEEEGERI